MLLMVPMRAQENHEDCYQKWCQYFKYLALVSVL